MYIIESKNYKKDYKKKILDKHLLKEKLCIQNIIDLILNKENMQDLINDVFKSIYHIEQKSGNLCEIYTARINGKLRLVMKPCGEYPYKLIEITDIEFIEIDDKHYKEG